MSDRSWLRPALLALALVSTACGSGNDGGGGGSPAGEPTSSGTVELSLEEEMEAELEIPDEPDYMAAGFGSVWVTRGEAAVVDRIDPETNEVVSSIEVGSHPGNGLVAEFDSLWAPSQDEQALYRIDPEAEKVSATIEVPVFLSTTGALGHELSAGAGAVWMVTEGKSGEFDALARIDPEKEEVEAVIDLGYAGAGVAATDEAVWVTAPDDGLVLRVDPSSNEVVAEISGLAAPNFVAAGDEGVWVISGYDSQRTGGDGSVSRIDPETNEVAATVRIDETPGQAGDIAVGEGFVWARTQYTLLAKVDPETETVVERYTDRKGIGSVLVDSGSVWLSDYAFNNVWRVPV